MKENEKHLIHTQNLRRFPGFTVVVVTFFSSKSSTISMILFRNVSLSRGKSTTRFWEVTVFQKKSDNFHWTRNKNTHFTDENERKKIAKVSPSNNNYSFRIISPFNNNNSRNCSIQFCVDYSRSHGGIL